MSEELWLALGAAFGPVLREAFPKASSRERMQVSEALVGEVRKRESWFAAAPDLLAASEAVVRFWGDPEAWGDFASLTTAAGKFAPIAEACRAAVAKATPNKPMPMLIDEAWCLRMAELEGDHEVGAGFEAALNPDRFRELAALSLAIDGGKR